MSDFAHDGPEYDDDPAYEAYMDELVKRHEEGRDYPIGEMIDCYTCQPVTGIKRRCVALGPITNRADPTQTYRLDCGHLAI